MVAIASRLRGVLRTDVPFDPARLPFFYGWVIVAASTVGIIASIPGQTVGVSAFTDHLLGSTGLSRFELSNAYLAGTLASGLLLPRGGRLLDRLGARAMVLLSCATLALTLIMLSASDVLARSLATVAPWMSPSWLALGVLGLCFTSLRFSGQGMLTMVSRTMLGKWFDRRRGMAAGLSGIVVSFSFASAPLGLSALVAEVGWRSAWLLLAAGVGLGMGVIGWMFFRDNPEECGLVMDGGAPPAGPAAGTTATSRPDLTRDAALRTAAFWAVTLALSMHGLVLTGFTFHIVDVGAEQGLGEAEAMSLFLPMAILATGLGYVVGIASDRLPIQLLVAAMMGTELLGLLGAANLGEPTWRWAAVAGLGATGGFFGPLSTVAMPHFFGRTHLGAIAGVQMMVMVVGSALGPSFLAFSRQSWGSYAPALYACGLLPLGIAALALRARNPRAGG